MELWKKLCFFGLVCMGWGLIFGSGCGAIKSTSNILDAKAAIQSAHSAKGWYWACHEYYAANRYLEKALEEAGFSDFGVAATFAALATRYARQSQKLAEKRSSRRSFPPVTCNAPKKMAKKYQPLLKFKAPK